MRPPLATGGGSGGGKSSISKLLRDAVARQQEQAEAEAALAGRAAAASGRVVVVGAAQEAERKPSAWDEAVGLLCMVAAFVSLAGVGLILALSIQGGTDGGGFEGRPHWVQAHLPVMQRGGQRGDVTAEVRVSLAELAREAVVNVSFHREEVCASCGGAGGSGTQRCPACQGAGSVPVFGGMMRTQCGHCGGRGVKHAHVCHTCGGSGHVHRRAEEAVRLTAGLAGGDVIRMVGAGGRSSNGAGDLEVRVVEVAPTTALSAAPAITRCSDPTYCVGGRNDDLLVHVRLHLAEALLGWRRMLQHPRGGEVEVGNEAGVVTQPGELLRFPGKGMPRRSAAATSRTFFTSGGAVQHELQLPGAPPDPPRGTAFICRLPLIGAAACPPSSAFGTLIVVTHVDLPPSLSVAQAAVAATFPQSRAPRHSSPPAPSVERPDDPVADTADEL